MQVQQGMLLEDPIRENQIKMATEGVPLLTMDLVRERAREGLVIVTCASWQYYDFALNWVSHLRKLNVTNFLIGTSLALLYVDL